MEKLSLSAVHRTIHKKPPDYVRMPWKNGCGITYQICIHPESASFPSDQFLWRLSSAEINSPCNFSQFPGYTNTIIVLPSSHSDAVSLDGSLLQSSLSQLSPAAQSGDATSQQQLMNIQKKRQASIKVEIPVQGGASKSEVIQQLTPFTFSADVALSATPSRPLRDITIMTKNDSFKADVNVEIIDIEQNFRRLILGSQCAVYCIEGVVKVLMEGDKSVRQSGDKLSQSSSFSGAWLRAGETLILDRGESAAPKHLRAIVGVIDPQTGKPKPAPRSGGIDNDSSQEDNDDDDADEQQRYVEPKILLIQLHDVRGQQHSSQTGTPRLSLKGSAVASRQGSMVDVAPEMAWKNEGVIQVQTPAIVKVSSTDNVQGGVEVQDDKCFWAMPDELADSMNLSQVPGRHRSVSIHGISLAETPGVKSGVSRQSSMFQFPPHQLYTPPDWLVYGNGDIKSSITMEKDSFNVEDFPIGQISTAWIKVMKQGLSDWLKIPIIVARGSAQSRPQTDMNGTAPGVQQQQSSTPQPDPADIIVGITAALHGNEINGVSCIHKLFADLDVTKLTGTVVAIPVLNVPGYLNFQREFSDGKDLNRLFPGKLGGTASQAYAHIIMTKLIAHFNYLIDLHTASFGRVNSYYVRADMNDPVTAKLAKLQQPQIILHNSGQDGTMRSAASTRGIKSVTVEIGNPQQFQNQFIMWSFQGLLNTLEHLGMYYAADIEDTLSIVESKKKLEDISTRDTMDPSQLRSLIAPYDPNALIINEEQPLPPIVCNHGFWTYTTTGGVLEVFPSVNSFVQKGMLVAWIKDIFGNVQEEYHAPCDAMVIGRSSNPVAMSGDRIIHFGVPHQKGQPLPKVAKENY
ncbi:hypothetical protein MP228_001158 [Amoeboaphelidium protococcarum]|nr:hypothetical protein MP228_001158 [Amoeboaphelidium protococcarum]